ncbi:phosphatase phospho-type [Blastocladiella britannica]|nr:phosphatase phospho-type [Blastocladiella britannica]
MQALYGHAITSNTQGSLVVVAQHPRAPPTPTDPQSTVVVFDFDWTLIDADSDELCVRAVGGDAAVESLRDRYARGGVWCELVAAEIATAFETHDLTLATLAAILKSAPMHPQTLALLRDLRDRGCTVVVLSDANTYFIETILAAYGVRDCVHTIITNPSSLMRTASLREVLAVAPLQGAHDPHTCPRACPSNLCKSAMLQRWLAKGPSQESVRLMSRVLYVGDGTNDLCPMASPGLVDVGFVRHGKSLYRRMVAALQPDNGMPVVESGEWVGPSAVACKAVVWRDGTDLYQFVMAEVDKVTIV